MREELKTSLNLRHDKHDHVFDDRFVSTFSCVLLSGIRVFFGIFGRCR